MRWYIYKSPRSFDSQPIETMNVEPNEDLVKLKARKYGPIIIISEEELRQEKRDENVVNNA